MPDETAEELKIVTIMLPVSMVEKLREEARKSFRTLDGQIAWTINSRLPQAAGVRRSTDGYGADLLDAIKDLHLQQGRPSVRNIAQRAAHHIAASTVSEVLAGKKAVRWDLLEILIKALDGDVEHFRELWVQDQSER